MPSPRLQAHNAFDPKRRSAVVSKTFRRYLDQFERQVFNGPPENTRGRPRVGCTAVGRAPPELCPDSCLQA